MLNIITKTTNLELTPAIKNYSEEKISQLEKFLSTITIVRLELQRLTEHKSGKVFRAEATVDVPHGVFRAESTAEDLYAAVDLLIPKILAQLKKYKNKKTEQVKKVRRRMKEGEL